jgi:signal transduction histidine kinase
LKREVLRLKNLVLELLDAARAEQGRLVGERTETDLVECATEICTRHESPTHSCRVEAEGSMVGLYDLSRIQQLIENLVENAIKYSPNGGPVSVKVWSEDGWNRIAVTDRGIGIPPGDLPHVFDRFHRGSNVDDRKFAGMGLGLYICQGIVTEHGGRIWVESSASEGASSGNGRAQIGEHGTQVETGSDRYRGGSGYTTFHVALPTTTGSAGSEALPIAAGDRV